MSYQDKYLKYKNKYLELKSIIQSGGAQPEAGGAVPLGLDTASLGYKVVTSFEGQWNSDLPLPAKVGDHVQATTGDYLGHIVKIVTIDFKRLVLNTGLYVMPSEQNSTWIPITLPDGVKIIDERPIPDNLENGPWAKVESGEIKDLFNMRGNYVVGKKGQYWGRVYGVSGEAWKLIDGNPPPGRIAKIGTVFNNTFGNEFKWFQLRFPAGVRLEDTRRPASDYGPDAIALPGPIPLPPPPPAPLPINVTDCSICFSDKNYNLVGDDPLRVVVLPCGHTFHRGCVDPWIASRHECPTCRAPARVASNLMLGGGLY